MDTPFTMELPLPGAVEKTGGIYFPVELCLTNSSTNKQCEMLEDSYVLKLNELNKRSILFIKR